MASIKKAIDTIYQLGVRLNKLDNVKKIAIENEDYMAAKSIK